MLSSSHNDRTPKEFRLAIEELLARPLSCDEDDPSHAEEIARGIIFHRVPYSMTDSGMVVDLDSADPESLRALVESVSCVRDCFPSKNDDRPPSLRRSSGSQSAKPVCRKNQYHTVMKKLTRPSGFS